MKFIVCLLVIMSSIQFGFSQEESSVKIISNLNKIETMYFKYLSVQERKEAIKLMNETRGLAAGVTGNVSKKAKHNDVNLLSDESLQSLLNQIESENSDDSKTTAVLAIGKNGKITCQQLEKIIKLYSYDSYKIGLLHSIANNIIDPVNIGIVLKHIDSISTRRDLEKFFKDR